MKINHDKLIASLILQIIGLFLIDYLKLHNFQVEVILSILNTVLIICLHKFQK